MIFLFAGIVVGIVIGIGFSMLIAVLIWHEETSDFDIEEIMAQPQMSEIERHRAMHMRGSHGTDIASGVRSGSA